MRDYQASATDKMIAVLIYTLFALFALICVYPFYSIVINTISANDISAKGEIIFFPGKSISRTTWMCLKYRDCGMPPRYLWKEP
ncbi:hypothetical protein LJK87_01820 [Paenibacillus sp. P25]|nr:hypothetical protein LJK87_01820 [Paenibacillus sp. P25]